MWNLKKEHSELRCRTDTHSDFEKLIVSKGGSMGFGGMGLGWKCYKTGL